jgi:hypothetical protein
VVICSYNDHLRLLSPEPFGWLAPPKLTRVWEPTLFMESITPTILPSHPSGGSMSVIA